jgi:hypothetical protein
VVEATEAVIVDAAEGPAGAREVELKLIVTPAGCPLAVRLTVVSSGPGIMLFVIVEVPLPPGAKESEAGEAGILKFST